MSVRPIQSGQSKQLDKLFHNTVLPLLYFQRIFGHVHVSGKPGKQFYPSKSWRVYSVLLNVILLVSVVVQILAYLSDLQEFSAKRGVFVAFSVTAGYGAGPLLRVTAVLLSAGVTGRKIGSVLNSLQSVSDVMAVESAAFATRMRRFRRLSIVLLLLLLLLTAGETALRAMQPQERCPMVANVRHCGWHLLLSPGRFIMSVSYVMVPGQLLLLSLVCAACLRCLDDQVRCLRPEQARLAEHLRHLRAQHQLLVDAHRQLTAASRAALVFAMTAGIFAQITGSCLMSWGLVDALVGSGRLLVLALLRLALHVLAAVVVLVAPAEAGQQCLQPLGDTQRHLLRLETRPADPADQQRRLYLAELTHDLESVGDLGLFRLRRSLVLAVANITFTSIMIMSQFQQAQEAACPASSG